MWFFKSIEWWAAVYSSLHKEMLQHPQNTLLRQSELVRVESTDTIPKIGALTYKRGYIHLDLRRYNGVYCDSGDRLLAFREGRDFNPLAKSDRSVPPIEHMKLV